MIGDLRLEGHRALENRTVRCDWTVSCGRTLVRRESVPSPCDGINPFNPPAGVSYLSCPAPAHGRASVVSYEPYVDQTPHFDCNAPFTRPTEAQMLSACKRTYGFDDGEPYASEGFCCVAQ